jgi:hypothetical protein
LRSNVVFEENPPTQTTGSETHHSGSSRTLNFESVFFSIKFIKLVATTILVPSVSELLSPVDPGILANHTGENTSQLKDKIPSLVSSFGIHCTTFLSPAGTKSFLSLSNAHKTSRDLSFEDFLSRRNETSFE